MAASSSSVVLTTRKGGWTYDVFLSFRGEDTRNNFVDHLFADLVRNRIRTFKDDEMLGGGQPISQELLKAIKESRWAVVVFSKNYANSSWCLEELSKIMECHKQMEGQIKVLPVFYHVYPSDVREQKGDYATAFKTHEDKFKGGEMDKVNNWRDALTAAASLSGQHISPNYGGEASFINKIVQQISSDIQPRGGSSENHLIAANQYHKELQRQPRIINGKKRAVLCGVTYNGHKKKLEASIRNVRSMQRLLVDNLGFPNASILILTEEESDRSRIPTKRNIQMALQWLIQGCRYGDSLMFYYSGHACQVPDEDGDERDGYDEALCPLDYRVAGVILDDEINATIVAPLTHGVTLHSVIDTCFSGTVLDLPFLCRINQDGLYRWETEHQIKNKGTRGGKAVGISACADNQNSADTSAFTGNDIGALTFSFIQAIQADRNLTYGSLLTSMRKKVRQAQQFAGRFMPFETSKSQEPQLSSAARFEIYSEPFML